MTLVEKVEKAYTEEGEKYGFLPTVVHLCDRHNQEVAEEIRETTEQLNGWYPLVVYMRGSRVSMLFQRPVIEETQNGVVKCLLCT
jgi:hypothetical protein